MSEAPPVGPVKNGWDAFNQLVLDEAVTITVYDIALKALAFAIRSLAVIGTPAFGILLAASFVIDASIFYQWPDYVPRIKKFVHGKQVIPPPKTSEQPPATDVSQTKAATPSPEPTTSQ